MKQFVGASLATNKRRQEVGKRLKISYRSSCDMLLLLLQCFLQLRLNCSEHLLRAKQQRLQQPLVSCRRTAAAAASLSSILLAASAVAGLAAAAQGVAASAAVAALVAGCSSNMLWWNFPGVSGGSSGPRVPRRCLRDHESARDALLLLVSS